MPTSRPSTHHARTCSSRASLAASTCHRADVVDKGCLRGGPGNTALEPLSDPLASLRPCASVRMAARHGGNLRDPPPVCLTLVIDGVSRSKRSAGDRSNLLGPLHRSPQVPIELQLHPELRTR